MRRRFGKIINELAKKDKKIVLLVGDIGYGIFDDFRKNHPNRFFNLGICEQSLVGTAAGMALEGLKPWVYTITPFLIERPFEQIKLDIAYPNLPVIIVGTGAGLSYSSLGVTHHSLEDIACMRMLPNMNVICPGDSVEVKLAVEAALNSKEPCYIRLGKKGEEITLKYTLYKV